MKYLLDVNALVACRHTTHPHHVAFQRWAVGVGFSRLHTCAHAELGFLRVSMQAIRMTRAQAAAALAEIRAWMGGYISDCPPPQLAHWATSHKQTTDAYLCQLAAAHGMQLATFDAGIKDAAAYLIS